jgi:4,5-DOPA dioxygenase extradiol
MMPSVFISHGAPDRILGHSSAKTFIENFSQLIEKPAAILVISAHWMTQHVTLSSASEHKTIYDFGGFPNELTAYRYPAKQPSWLLQMVGDCLASRDIFFTVDDRGLDHGAWTVLAMAYPEVDIPVIAMSLPSYPQMKDYLDLGKCLLSLRNSNVLILGSGSATHNLYELSRSTKVPEWAETFVASLQAAVIDNNYEFLGDIYQHLPYAHRAHPTPEHYLPLLIAMGAAYKEKSQLLHNSFEFGSLNSSSWLFGVNLESVI